MNSFCSGLFSRGIHVGPGVSSVFKNIELIIAKGSRFLFPHRFSATLPKIALNDLFNRLRWKYFFLNSDDTQNFYDPNFATKRTEAAAAGDPCPKEVEEAFQEAETELYRQLKAIAPDVRQSDTQSRADLSSLERYLAIEGLLLKQSDKNLGLCLIKKDWYIKELSNMLDNDPCYREVTLDFAQQETSRLGNRLKTMQMGMLPAAQRKFLRDAFLAFAEFRWPQIHRIPKVQKQPLKIRPIVPCHSHPANHASKVLSRMLKPLLSQLETILESSHVLARELRVFKVPKNKKLWLCSGDVKAMYPNISRKRAHNRVVKMWIDNYGKLLSDLVRDLLEVSDVYLFAEFYGTYFYQDGGLAMAVPAAPDVAQLYCAFEESTAERFKDDNILLYRCYIDDILVILIAEDKTSAMEDLSDLSFHSLEIIWEADERSTTFLNLSLSLENDSIVFRPYRKPLNHYKQLPFSSSHPLLVKRDIFLEEMSRMARLCSFEKDYKTAVYQVRDIYLHRGYPVGMLNSWIKNNYKSKWQSRILKVSRKYTETDDEVHGGE